MAVKDGTIAGIGPMEELPPENMAKKVIDAEGLAVMPGLIDGHGHGGHCLIKNLGDHYEDWDNMAEEIYFRYTDDFFWYAEGRGREGQVRHYDGGFDDRQHPQARRA